MLECIQTGGKLKSMKVKKSQEHEKKKKRKGRRNMNKDNI